MKTLKPLFAGFLFYCVSSLAMAATNPISVHVLNLQDGLPAPGVTVILERQEGSNWKQLESGVTNEQGRISALYPADRKLENVPTGSPSKRAHGSSSTTSQVSFPRSRYLHG